MSARTAVAGQRLGLAQHQVREGQRVDAHVEQRAAAQRRGQEPVVGRPVDDEAEVGVHLARRAEPARGEPARAARGRPGCRPSTCASMRNTPALAGQVDQRLRPRPALRVSGFSQSTALPASSAGRACARCRACGEATYTTSTSGSAASSSTEPWARCRRRRTRGRRPPPVSTDREPTAASSAPGTSARSRAKLCAIFAGRADSPAVVMPRPWHTRRHRWRATRRRLAAERMTSVWFVA